MKERNIIFAARVVSAMFSPFYLAIIGLAILFLFSYLSLLPLGYKLSVMGMVYICTILLPTFLIRVYRRYQGWSRIELGMKERRMIPYVIAIVCYFLCYYLMNLLHIPHFMSSIIVAALGIQVVCAIINLWWKVSTHMAAIGGVAGSLAVEKIGFRPSLRQGLPELLLHLQGVAAARRRVHNKRQWPHASAPAHVLSAVSPPECSARSARRSGRTPAAGPQACRSDRTHR